MTKISLGNAFDLNNFDEVLSDKVLDLKIIKIRVCKMVNDKSKKYTTIDIFR